VFQSRAGYPDIIFIGPSSRISIHSMTRYKVSLITNIALYPVLPPNRFCNMKRKGTDLIVTGIALKSLFELLEV
jgi:hypothetical protein